MENNQNKGKIILYTDGACTGNPGPGGRGVVIILNSECGILNAGKPILLSGKEKHTTNNQMELTAVIKGLEWLCKELNMDLPQAPEEFSGFDFSGDGKKLFGNDQGRGAQPRKAAGLGITNTVTIYIDSQYVKQGIEERIHTRKRNNWRTSNRKPVANRELWQELDALVGVFDIQRHWVKGHAGDKYNEMADKLASGR